VLASEIDHVTAAPCAVLMILLSLLIARVFYEPSRRVAGR
jgi:hypothetical protein